MGKLKDDEIRWILSLDAGGVQTQIAAISSQSRILEQDNKRLAQEIKEASVQMNVAEKEMLKLEKAGKTNTETYKEAKGTFEAAKIEVADYKTKVQENSKAIDDNNAKAKEVIQTMKLQDMTMGQLKSRASELAKQLNNTSQAASPDAYKKLQKEIGGVHDQMGILKDKNKSLLDQFAGMSNPVGSAAQSVIGFGQAAKALIANPLGWIILAIAAAFYMLKTAIEGNEDAATTFKGIMGALGSLFDSWKRAVIEVTAALFHLVTLDFKALGKNIENLVGLGSHLEDNAKSAYAAAKAEEELNHAIDRNNDLTSVNKARIAELRLVAQDSTKTTAERIAAAKELAKIEKANYDMAVSNAQGLFIVYKSKNKDLMDVIQKNSGAQMNEVNKYMEIVKAGNELSFEQRTKMTNLVNDIATDMKDANEDQRKEFRSFFSDLSNINQEYNSGRKKDSKLLHKQEAEEQKQKEEAEKKAIEDAINRNEQALEVKINGLKANKIKGLLTEEAYNKAVESATTKSLQNELQIKGIGNDKILALRGQLLDAQLKQQQEFDKQHDNRKKLLEETSVALELETFAYNNRLKAANLFEVDLSKLTAEQLAQRTELEAEYQKNVSKIAVDAENKRFADAKKASGVDVADPTKLQGEKLKALETLTAQHQANLTKITADGEKKRADFEKSVDETILDALQKANEAQLKSIEAVKVAKQQSAKSDYANGIINKQQYDAKIADIDDSALNDRLKAQKEFNSLIAGLELTATPKYTAALQASQKAVSDTQTQIDDAKIKNEDKFQKEKALVGKKYAKGSIAEEYVLAKAALDKQHKDGILSEQAYQDQLRKLKLGKASKYIGEAQKLISAGSDAVATIQQAETDKVSAEYQKRQSALTEQLNSGLISQDEYNTQKGQLDLEQKQKELDIQKKYADAAFAIQAAQIIATTAQGIISVWASSMTLGPIAGPIAAGILTTLLVGTGAAQLASANAQREKIKSTTLEGSSSGGSTPNASAAYVANGSSSGYADGGYNDDGGYTGDGGKYEVAGFLPNGKPFHRGEYFVAQEEMSNPAIVPLVRSIESVRRQRTSSNPLPDGYADGGFNSVGSNQSPGIIDVINEILNQLKEIKSTKLKSEINYHEFKYVETLIEKSKTLASR